MEVIIKNANLTAVINPKGAELVSLKTKDREFMWEGDPQFWGKHSPVLFPIVGTLKDNQFQYNNIDYELSRHGFARDMDFEIKEQSRERAIFSLKSSEETLKRYPFLFELQLIYTIEENKLNLEYKVFNMDNKSIPFSIGGHPAFALPLGFNDYSLSFEDDIILEHYLLENDLLSDITETIYLKDKKLRLDYSIFERDALVFKKFNSKSISILEKSVPILKMNIQDFPNLGIWTKTDAPFICIEPWFGYSDTPKNNRNLFEKEAIQILDPNTVFERKFSIEII